jgi:predicted nucleotide-binding protein (sugar kinase/HSP70/actin superfamily)
MKSAQAREGWGNGKVFIPAMAEGSARLLAAAFRALGIDADVTPPSDARTLELGSRYTGGDECFPAKVTVGDFMKVLERPDMDPSNVVFFMPSADGPCRFGQYATYMRRVLDTNGYHGVSILSPTCGDGYVGLNHLARPFLRTAWRAAVAGDALYKLLLMIRPYEVHPGATDRVHAEAIARLAKDIEEAPLDPNQQWRAIARSLRICRDAFREIRIERDTGRPLVGIVGEIFCRLNAFSNNDLVRRIEEYGGEVWISDFSEWVWYSNTEELRLMRLNKRSYTAAAMAARVRNHVQRRDEDRIVEVFREDFAGREEPHVEEVLEAARNYLPADGAIGEMVLNVGKAVCFARRGADGIIDISPFTCMNGVVSEALYPRVSADLGGIPIRSLYFDGTHIDLELDLGIFVEMARARRTRRRLAAAV